MLFCLTLQIHKEHFRYVESKLLCIISAVVHWKPLKRKDSWRIETTMLNSMFSILLGTKIASTYLQVVIMTG